MKSYYFLLIISFCLISCHKEKKESIEIVSETSKAEATSFLGEPLYPKIVDAKIIEDANAAIKTIKNTEDLSEDDYIAIARHLVASRRFRAVIDNFTEAIKKFPNSFKMYRHRGHRYLNLRELDKAIADLSKAEVLIREQPEIWEYDSEGNPTATYQHQIWYHIGLHHFLKRDYKTSASAFEKSLTYADQGDDIAGASN